MDRDSADLPLLAVPERIKNKPKSYKGGGEECRAGKQGGMPGEAERHAKTSVEERCYRRKRPLEAPFSYAQSGKSALCIASAHTILARSVSVM